MARPRLKRTQQGAQVLLTRVSPKLAQGFCFNLPDSFSRNGKTLADLFECTGIPVLESKAHPDDLLFARTQNLQGGLRALLQIGADNDFGR